MKYTNETVRRQDRLMSETRALELLRSSEYGVLSMVTEEGLPYGIPINYVWDGGNSIYIHCAPEGKKLRALAKNSHVTFCIIGNVNLLPGKFTTEYESVVLYGEARTGLTAEERMKALHLLINKLSADFKELGDKYAHQSFHRTEIIRVDFETFSGKCKHVRTAD